MVSAASPAGGTSEQAAERIRVRQRTPPITKKIFEECITSRSSLAYIQSILDTSGSIVKEERVLEAGVFQKPPSLVLPGPARSSFSMHCVNLHLLAVRHLRNAVTSTYRNPKSSEVCISMSTDRYSLKKRETKENEAIDFYSKDFCQPGFSRPV